MTSHIGRPASWRCCAIVFAPLISAPRQHPTSVGDYRASFASMVSIMSVLRLAYISADDEAAVKPHASSRISRISI